MSDTASIGLPFPVRVGRKWFQWRSFSPIPLFVLLLVLPPEFEPNSWTVALSVLGAVAGEALRIWGVGYAGSATRTRGDNIPELVTAGPYLYIRNPLYVGNMLLYTCCGFAFGFFYLSLFILAYSAIQYAMIVRYEESMLVSHFGEAYRVYQSKVPRWLPLAQPGISASSHQFDLKRALRSERSTLYCISGMIVLMLVKESFRTRPL